MLKTPVLFILFNRPDATSRVFDAIRKARPERLFIAADGPRKNRPGEAELCKAVREIVKKVDWPCEVTSRFQDENLGCKIHASGAVTWFFQHVEEGIIIEDDCLPDGSFFVFCNELLERYRDNDKIMHVSGADFLSPDQIGDPSFSYRFSRIAHLWGWATWRRAWEKYDIRMAHLDSLEKSKAARKMFLKGKYFRYWMKHCRHIGSKNIDTWDAQWQYTILYNNGCSVSSNTNLIQNIGFGPNATHTTSENEHQEPVMEMKMPIKHPDSVMVDMRADAHLMEKMYLRSIWKKILSRIR